MDLPEGTDRVRLDAAFVGVVERGENLVRMLGVEPVFEPGVGNGERDGVLEQKCRSAVGILVRFRGGVSARRDGTISDAKTLCAWLYWKLRGPAA